MRSILLYLCYFVTISISSFAGETKNDSLNIQVVIFNEMLKTISPEQYDVCYISIQDTNSYTAVKTCLNQKPGIRFDMGCNAKINDGKVRGRNNSKLGIILKVKIETVEDDTSAIATGAWFSTSKSSQSTMYWLRKNPENGSWEISKKQVLFIS